MGEGNGYTAYALRAIVERLVSVLEAFFGGYLVVESPALNGIYLLLAKRGRELAQPYREADQALEQLLEVFPNLYESIGHEDSPDENWEFGQDVVRRLKARTSELWVERATAAVSLREPDVSLTTTCDQVLQRFRAAKADAERRWLAQADEAARKSQEPSQRAGRMSPAPAETAAQPVTPALEDEAHAACVEALVAKLRTEGAHPKTEVTYSRFGERGSVDVCCLEGPKNVDSPTGCAIYEIWTEVRNLNQALRKLDEKARVVPETMAEQEAVARPSLVRAHLVLLATKQNMELIASHDQTFVSKFSDSLAGGTRFFLQAFDPITGDLHTLLPAPQRAGAGLDSSDIRRWARFPSKQAFLQAWRKRAARG